MGTPGSEFDNRPSVCRFRYARRFTGDHGLKIDCGQQKRLHNLRFDNGRGDAQDRFAREKYGAFRHRPHTAGKMELREVVEKIGHDDAPTARSVPARVKFSQFQPVVRGTSSLVPPQRKAAVREEHLSSYISVRLEEEAHRACNVLRAAEPRYRAT